MLFMLSVAVEALGSQEASASLGSAYFLTSIKISNKINRVKFKLFIGNHLLTIYLGGDSHFLLPSRPQPPRNDSFITKQLVIYR